jgi:transcriptional regulator with XRE-family HTH domain
MSEKFKQARQEKGLTLQDIAYESRVSRPTLDRIEAGEPVRYENAVRAVNALNRLTKANHTVESLEIAVSQ